MKKFYAIAAMMVLCAASFAQSVSNSRSVVQPKQKAQMPTEQIQKMKHSSVVLPKSDSSKNLQKKANSFDVSGLSIITDQPEGTEKKMIVTSTYYMVYWGEVYYDDNYGRMTSLVEGTDGYYYLKDPFTGIATNSWLKLEKEDDGSFVAKLPQAIYNEPAEDDYEEYNGYAYAMEMYSYEEDGETWYSYRPVDTQEYRFTMSGDTLKSADPELMLGMGSETGGWNGYGDYNIAISDFTEKLVEVSDEVANSALDFALTYTDYEDSRFGHIVKGAFDGEGHVYVKGLFPSLPDVWVEGTFDGKQAVFPSGQYMGYNEGYKSLTYFVGATLGEVYDEYYDEYYEGYIAADNITFDVDVNTMTMTTDGQILLNTNKGQYVSYVTVLTDPEVSLYTEKAGTPQDPEFVSFEDYDEESGWGVISTYLPVFDTTGALMDASKMTYKYYIDDDEFVVDPDTYGVSEDMTVLPYDFVTGTYFNDIFSDGGMHYLYYYTTGFDKFGVQTTYNGGGESHSSDIVWYIVDGVKGINMNSGIHGDVKSVSYTDLSGRKVSRIGHGLYLKTTTYADGTVESKKVIRK